MRSYSGRVIEIVLDQQGEAGAWIACPSGAVPGPGQYVLAQDPGDLDSPLPVPLFRANFSQDVFLCAPPIPRTWEPGTPLELWGVLGRGFHLPSSLQRLACAALGSSMARLLPVVREALSQGAAVVLFTDLPLPSLSSDLEVQPLSALPEELYWPDFLALDLTAGQLPELRSILKINPSVVIPYPVQALILSSMPCGGAADCGVCAVPARGPASRAFAARSGWKLACKDGPVFDLAELEW
jgi:NAD(P)H-flavin reductase